MTAERCRIDVWLWRARFFKSRALAARFVEAGGVRCPRAEGGRFDKASRSVAPGDRLTFALAGRVVSLEIAAIGTRRGPATEARGLYVPLGPLSGSAEVPPGEEPGSG